MKRDFRLPKAIVDKNYREDGLMVAVGVAIVPFVAPGESFLVLAMTVLIVVGVLGVSYWMSRRFIWVSMDERGMSSIGHTGRSVDIPWGEAVRIAETTRSRMPGVHVLSASSTGPIKSIVSSFFIPKAILASPEFASALRDLAPDSHPLLQYIENG